MRTLLILAGCAVLAGCVDKEERLQALNLDLVSAEIDARYYQHMLDSLEVENGMRYLDSLSGGRRIERSARPDVTPIPFMPDDTSDIGRAYWLILRDSVTPAKERLQLAQREMNRFMGR